MWRASRTSLISPALGVLFLFGATPETYPVSIVFISMEAGLGGNWPRLRRTAKCAVAE